jgi:flagellar biosynthetic protein FliQ
MSEGEVLKVVQEGLMTIIYVSAPPLLLGLAVGLIVSIFQAVTSIQEQTLAFVPKILAVFLGIYMFGSWMWTLLQEYTINIITNLPNYMSG